MVALCVGITAILMLAFTRADLLEGWRARVPADAPDRFILNVQPEQRSAVDQFLREAGFATSVWYPMIRGRLTAINGRAVSAADYTDERARRLVEREFNLSWTDELPPGNTLAQGRWQDAGLDPQGGFSVEEGLARTLGIVLGDQLGWSVAGQAVSGRVTSLRRLHWDSMQVNFFVLSGPALLGASPPTWITAVHLGAGADRAVGRLLREQPNLTVVDTTALLAQLMSIIDRVSAAVRALFGFTLLAGVLVLASAATLLRDERLHEAAVMRALGASRAQLMRVAITEVLLLGALAGLMGALLASAAGWLLAVRVFEIVPRHDPAVWWAGPALGLACAAWLALSSARLASRGSPLAVLRAGN
jgi:putative ABC transport system permease protein